jgi:transposase
MPPLAAIRFNPDLATKYAHLRAARKPPKVAMATIMRKLLESTNV